ncbi:MAG TPA: hypothetical protein PLK30_21970 [Blastocatellia bacterium]|nr:hypothetical protein [Blastocatellia bacterium]
MQPRRFPKYFQSRAGAPNPARQPQAPAHVVDCFRFSNHYTAGQEWIVATDSLGNLRALADDNRNNLPAQVQTELAWFEMSGYRKRQIEATELYLFYLQVLEQLPEAPGLNDPIYLYGTLFGPYPSASPVAGIEGQLTITRADLLEGMLIGAEFSFRFAGNGKGTPRCFHLPLPADSDEEIRQGRGVVLAYPLLPPELILTDVANELFCCRLLYDTLTALKSDAEEEKISHPLNQITLPVPSRALLEQQLQAEGYEIKDNKAVRKTGRDDERSGLLATVMSALLNESLKLPPEGRPEDFIELAKLTLQALPGWPSARTLALRNLIRPAVPGSGHKTTNSPSPSFPQTTYSRPKPPRRLEPLNDNPPNWVQDFLVTHQSSNTAKPRLTSNSATDTNFPDWMKDFVGDSIPSVIQTDSDETNASHKSPTNRLTQNNPPDWMDDFD